MRFSSAGKMRKALVTSVALITLCAVVIVAVPRLNWRAHVLLLHITGQIPDISLKDTLAYMMPGSEQWLVPLIWTRNPYAVVHNFRTAPSDIAAGSVLFRTKCAVCHSPDGSGGPGGPALAGRLKHGESDWAIYRAVRLGIPKTPMPAHELPDKELWQLVAFLRSISKRGDSTSAARQSPASGINVPYEEIAGVDEPSADWLTYSGSYSSIRHSSLKQIHRGNVDRLGVRWIHQFAGDPGDLQATPIVRRGVIYVTVANKRVMALSATDGKPIWTYEHKLSSEARGTEFGTMQNRGVAILNDKVFFTSVDARLIALSAATGAVKWETTVTTDLERFFITAAPLAYRDLVVTGVGSGSGGRSFIAAYDAETGRERWKFVVIPGPGEPGHETWAGDSWREGGGGTWLTGSYDPDLDLLYWGVGNPKPVYDASLRKGDNLYTNCVVALRGATGTLAWHFQFTPADDRDWDANQIPVLVDWSSAQGIDKRLLWANRNGFYYVLDRITGKFLSGTPFVRQTWTDGLDANGRPKPRTNLSLSREGVLVYPGNVGGTNWWSPSYDPALKLIFVPVLEQGMIYFTSAASPPQATGSEFYTAFRALNAESGQLAWEYRRPSRSVNNRMGGLLSTKTGLVFGGDEGTFFALDSRTGSVLWSVETGGVIVAAPITYSEGDEQFVAIVAGRSLLVFALPKHQQDKPGTHIRAAASPSRLK